MAKTKNYVNKKMDQEGFKEDPLMPNNWAPIVDASLPAAAGAGQIEHENETGADMSRDWRFVTQGNGQYGMQKYTMSPDGQPWEYGDITPINDQGMTIGDKFYSMDDMMKMATNISGYRNSRDPQMVQTLEAWNKAFNRSAEPSAQEAAQNKIDRANSVRVSSANTATENTRNQKSRRSNSRKEKYNNTKRR